ncbi:MAG: redox-sensing transcriptional repressor Rex [Firmicutes bacterium]|nr:redox-sensing transcriptional repressor Rex [Bacillota bacterium]
MRPARVPDVVVRRLAQYLRLLEEHGLMLGHYISSQELAELAGVTPAQVRKDLATFGEFGKQGVGYPARDLKVQLRSILKTDRPTNVAILGMGELGAALARYLTREQPDEASRPFRLVALFDVDPNKVGQHVQGIVIDHLDALAERVAGKGVQIAVLTVPASAAQFVLERAVKAGVRLFLNFAPVKLRAPEGVKVNSADVSLELHQLAFYL